MFVCRCWSIFLLYCLCLSIVFVCDGDGDGDGGGGGGGGVESEQKKVSRATAVPSSEIQALQDLYISTGGSKWLWKPPYIVFGHPWTFSSTNQKNPCSTVYPWQGVNCSSCQQTLCHITGLTLPFTNLCGKFLFWVLKTVL
jgi:hypothetical protein